MAHSYRCQGAVLDGTRLLVVQRRAPSGERQEWLLPGGSCAGDETEADCVLRALREATGLAVLVQRRLSDAFPPASTTGSPAPVYLCQIVAGEAVAGYEAAPETVFVITRLCWLDMRDPTHWPEEVLRTAPLAPLLQRIRRALGYAPVGVPNWRRQA